MLVGDSLLVYFSRREVCGRFSCGTSLRLLSPSGNTLQTGSTKSGSPVEKAGV